MRAGITGAALLPPAVGARFRQVTGRNLYEVYGMTEASGLMAFDPFAGASKAGSVGWALPYTRANVRRLGADGRLGEVCKAGEVQSAGGARGLIVKVTLPAAAASALPAVTQALASYLVEARVAVASWQVPTASCGPTAQ